MLFAFSLTLIAGLATTLGGFISFFIRKYNLKVLAVGLGFSAGAMIYISLVELLKEAQISLSNNFHENIAGLIVTLSFFIGIAISYLIDYFLPSHFEVESVISDNSDKTKVKKTKTKKQSKLWRVGIFTFFVISIHNFPEGLTTFSSAMVNPALGLSVAIAIAIHNIPEGISVALPIFYATGSKSKAILYSFISGMSEPIGALVGYKFIDIFFNNSAFGILIAITSGFMVYISFDELLPAAREYGKDHLSIIGLVLGMLIMALSLNALNFLS